MNSSLKLLILILSAHLATCLFTQTRASASPQNDRVYQLESLSWLKPYDNVDGIFADYIDDVYTQYFKKQSRFVVKPLKGLDSVLGNTSMRYVDLIQNKDVIKKIAQKFRAESILRTRIFKEAETYRFVIEWVYAPKGDVLSAVEFRYTDPHADQGLQSSDLPIAMNRALDELISKLPFLGQVTGVQGQTITVNIGKNQHVSRKQVLVIYTLQGVKRHPVLNTIEEWAWEKIGRAEVQEVEESISFAKILDVEPNQSIQQFQKIREILAPLPEEKHPETAEPNDVAFPRIGWVAGNIGIGNYSREVGVPSASGRTGSGLMENLEVESQIWLNSRWLAQGSLMQGFFKYSPNDLATGASIGTDYSGNVNQIRLAVGYSLFPAKTVFDAIGWVHAGIRHTGYSLPVQATDFTGPSSFTSLFIGIGGEIPVQDRIAAQLGIDLGLIKSASQDNPNFGSNSSSSDLMFSVGANYHYQDQWFLRLMLKFNSQSMDFPTGESVSQKMFSIMPSVMYYF